MRQQFTYTKHSKAASICQKVLESIGGVLEERRRMSLSVLTFSLLIRNEGQ